MAGEFTIKRIPDGYEAEFPIEEYGQVKTTANKYGRSLKATPKEARYDSEVGKTLRGLIKLLPSKASSMVFRF